MAKGIKGSRGAFYKCIRSKGWARELAHYSADRKSAQKMASERVEVLKEFFILPALPERLGCAASSYQGIGANRFE